MFKYKNTQLVHGETHTVRKVVKFVIRIFWILYSGSFAPSVQFLFGYPPVLAFKEPPFPTPITLILPSTVIVTSSSSEWANAEPSICKLNQRITNVSRQRESKRLLS